jgi:hypothetical protein
MAVVEDIVDSIPLTGTSTSGGKKAVNEMLAHGGKDARGSITDLLRYPLVKFILEEIPGAIHATGQLANAATNTLIGSAVTIATLGSPIAGALAGSVSGVLMTDQSSVQQKKGVRHLSDISAGIASLEKSVIDAVEATVNWQEELRTERTRNDLPAYALTMLMSLAAEHPGDR